jgi:hypothetical protein
VNVLESLELEAAFEPGARILARSINQRLKTRPGFGELWVRIRPPTDQEIKLGAARPTLVKFHRIASLVQIAKVLSEFVEVSCAGHTLLFEIDEFLETFVKVNYWPGRDSNPPPSTETP